LASTEREAKDLQPEGLLSPELRRHLLKASCGGPCKDRVHLAAQWHAVDSELAHADSPRFGEVYALRVPLERPWAAPCPLEMHLLVPDGAALTTGRTLQVVLTVRNVLSSGPVTFYFTADTTPDFLWLGCEKSEVIKLAPSASYSSTLQVYFPSPGVFNLNRLRLFVVGMPFGAGAVPASEQAPLAFALPFERLVHVRSEASSGEL